LTPSGVRDFSRDFERVFRSLPSICDTLMANWAGTTCFWVSGIGFGHFLITSPPQLPPTFHSFPGKFNSTMTELKIALN